MVAFNRDTIKKFLNFRKNTQIAKFSFDLFPFILNSYLLKTRLKQKDNPRNYFWSPARCKGKWLLQGPNMLWLPWAGGNITLVILHWIGHSQPAWAWGASPFNWGNFDNLHSTLGNKESVIILLIFHTFSMQFFLF